MQTITIERLKQSGWRQNRKIDVTAIKNRFYEIGLEFPENVSKFLEEFGMLFINSPEMNENDVDLNPINAIGVNVSHEYFENCLKDYGIDEDVFPIGETCRGNLLLLMTKENSFYEFTDGCVIKDGDSVDEMFDILVGKCKKGTCIC